MNPIARLHAACPGLFAAVLAGFMLVASVASADLTLQGPSGFIQAPSGTTIKKGGVEMSAHTRMYQVPGMHEDRALTNLSFGFSPLRDFELGVQKAMDSRNGSTDADPDATLNLKFRLPAVGSGEFSETAVGMVLDTNPNNYHTMYLTFGGFGVGWNFGGNPGSGVANYGSYDRGKREPKSLCLLAGADYPPSKAGERGYRGHFLLDYNGDVFSLGWRYKSHRGFWADLAFQSESSYTDFYDWKPVIFGLGAIF